MAAQISLQQRLDEGVPLLIAFERDLATCTALEITERWDGENQAEVERLLGKTIHEIIKNHNPIYYVAKKVFFSNKKAANNPRYLYEPYHREKFCDPVLAYILDPNPTYLGMLWLGPRDTYKSTFNHGVVPLWFIVRNWWLYGQDVRVVLRHHKEELAAANLRRLKSKFQYDPWMRRVWEEACPPPGTKEWHTQTSFSPAWGGLGEQAEHTVRALGSTASDTGFHADLDLGDDLVTEEHTKSAKIRQDAAHRYNAKRYTVDPEGKELNTGTRYHVHDLWQDMIDSEEDGRKLYKVVTIKAIEDDDTLAHPYKLTRDYLERRRQEEISRNHNDTFWHLQYQNSIRTSGLLVADKSWIKFIRQSDVDPRAWFVLLVDPAWKGTKNSGTGCAASIQVWAIERRGNILLYTLIDGVHSRELTPLDGTREIFRLAQKYGITDFGIEEVGWSFRTSVDTEGVSRGIIVNQIEFKTKQQAKLQRMSTLMKAMQAGRVFVAKECNPDLLEAWIAQVLDFPQLDEDDDDALDCGAYTQDPEVQESYTPNFNTRGWRGGGFAATSALPKRTRYGMS